VSTSLAASVATGNISLVQHSAQDSLQLDAELQRWQLSFSRPLNDHLSLRVELPYLAVSGGHLDNFIESWHRTFGLPNGNRAVSPTNRLLVQHQHMANVDYLRTAAASGIGDLTLRLGWNFTTQPTQQRALWFSLKLPSGAAGRLTGSGATDVALSLATAQSLSARFSTQQQLSLSLLGTGQRLSHQQLTAVWSGSLGLDAAITPHWSALLQLDAHSKVFTTGLRALGNALQLSLGPRYQHGAWQGSLFVSEDIAVDTAPDVQFQLAITRRYH
jgi:Protein of unknown function (DUF3187)